jgi:hypothetical protein
MLLYFSLPSLFNILGWYLWQNWLREVVFTYGAS